MNIKAPARASSGLLLMLVLLWELTGVRLGPAVRSTALSSDDIPALDSFSEPAVAAAVLQQHVRNLYFAFCLDDEGTNAVLRAGRGRPQGRARTPPDYQRLKALPMFSRDWRRIDRSSSRESLLELHDLTRALERDLLQTLLVVRFESQSWNEFLDCYLELMALAPERVELSSWTAPALLCAEDCGRTQEVLDALQHITRFGKDPRTVSCLQRVLEKWNTAKLQGVSAADSFALDPDSLCLVVNHSVPARTER